MNTLTSLPEELIALVLQSCPSFSDLRNLLLTSKTIYSAWQHNQRVTLWHVGQASIPAFSDALIAVRSTAIAKEFLLRHELPPDPFPVSSLSGEAIKPSLDEVKQVQDFTELAKYLERKTCSTEDKIPNFMPHRWYFDSLAWDESTWTAWREGYHRSVYRYLTAGAVLCRAYYTPLVSPKRPRGFLANVLTILEGIGAQQSEYPDWFSEREQAYLATIPLYSIEGHESWGKAFGCLEEIFLQESRKQQQQNNPTASGPYTSTISHVDPPEESGLRPLKALFGPKARNTQSLPPSHADTLLQQILQFFYLVDGEIRYLISLPGDTPAEDPADRLTHTVDAILFGSFSLARINIRQRADGSEAAFANPVLAPLQASSLSNGGIATEAEYLGFVNMHNYLMKVWDVGGIPNCYADDPIRKTPPPVSFFVEYMLRRYFGLRLAVTMFDATVENRCAWYAFHQYGGVFTGTAPEWYVGEDIVQGVDEPVPRAVYDEYACYY
ncbi:hypothetical protein BJX61DRAFT_262708 [Aspergillus egyptiacus]|nr:hypothetical protein BJX61DRAFT_262708 [Aspergillus egyptiacus]